MRAIIFQQGVPSNMVIARRSRNSCKALICFLAWAFSVTLAAEDRFWTDIIISKDGARADQACLKVFQGGFTSLRRLLPLLENDDEYHGQLLYFDDAGKRPEAAVVSGVALYLIHSILIGRLYEDPEPILRRGDGAKASSEDIKRLKDAYKRWILASLEDGSLIKSMGRDRVLENAKLRWTP